MATLVSGILRSHQRLQVDVEELKGAVLEIQDENDALRRTITMMQPKYHTLLHTFNSESEARLGWQLMHLWNYPDKYKTHEDIPPMPVGREYTAPWDDVPVAAPARPPSAIEQNYHGEL